MVWTPELSGQWLDLLVVWEARPYSLFHLVITRGLRCGEVCRLEWTDTDLTVTQTISVLEDEDAGAELETRGRDCGGRGGDDPAAGSGHRPSMIFCRVVQQWSDSAVTG